MIPFVAIADMHHAAGGVHGGVFFKMLDDEGRARFEPGIGV